MHEMSIMEEIFNIIQGEIVKNDVKKIFKVTMKAGSLTAVVPESLKFYFQCFAKGTVVEGAELEVIEISSKARCKKCNSEFKIEEYKFHCPQCNSPKLTIISGQELYVDNIEVE